MPRTKLGRDPAAEKAEFRRRLIESKAAARGVRTSTELAKRLKISRSGMSERLSGNRRFTLDEIMLLDAALRFDAEELAKLVSGK